MIGQNADLLNGLRQGVAVVGIARHATHANDQTVLARACHGHFDAKLVRLPRLSLGNEIHLRRMQTVEFVPVLRLFGEQAFDSC